MERVVRRNLRFDRRSDRRLSLRESSVRYRCFCGAKGDDLHEFTAYPRTKHAERSISRKSIMKVKRQPFTKLVNRYWVNANGSGLFNAEEAYPIWKLHLAAPVDSWNLCFVRSILGPP